MSYTCYQPSGAVPAHAYLFAGLCLAFALPLSVLYAWLALTLPDIVTLLLCPALAIGLSVTARWVCARVKVRSPRWMGWFGLLLGLCVWYFQWAAWTSFQLGAVGSGEGGVLFMATQPGRIARHALALVAPVSVVVQFACFAGWLAELFTLLFFPYFVAKMRAAEVFDESKGDWADYVESSRKFKFVDQSALVSVIHAPSATLSSILSPETDPHSMKYSRLRVFCRSEQGALVSLLEVEEKDGKENVIECSPGNFLHVSRAELDVLLAETVTSSSAEQTDSPELVHAIARMQAGDFQAAYAQALPFVSAEDERLYCDANRICAIACSDSAKWPQALGYWAALFAKESTAHNALQVATSSVMAGEIGQSAEWAERARTLNRATQEMPDVAIITGMLTALMAVGRPDAAMPFLVQLRDYYTLLRVTDPTVLFGHRMPLFHVFLDKSREIVDRALGGDERREWYASMLPHLDERGRAELSSWLDGACAPAQAP